jgi:Polysaccharide lyase
MRRTGTTQMLTIVATVLLATFGVPVPRAHAQISAPQPSRVMFAATSSGIVLSDDFESGVITNADSLMLNKIATAILTEPDGNHFLRMTATSEDCGPSFFTTCPRTRAELWIGSAPVTMNETVAYSFSLRIPRLNNLTGQDSLLWQLFQGYRIDPNGVRTIWLGIQNGRLYVANQTGGTTQKIDLGLVQYDIWVDYSMVVYLRDDSSGRVDVYMNATLIGSIVGQPTILFDQYVTDMFLNVVSFNGVLGSADFDNVQISRGVTSSSADSGNVPTSTDATVTQPHHPYCLPVGPSSC